MEPRSSNKMGSRIVDIEDCPIAGLVGKVSVEKDTTPLRYEKDGIVVHEHSVEDGQESVLDGSSALCRQGKVPETVHKRPIDLERSPTCKDRSPLRRQGRVSKPIHRYPTFQEPYVLPSQTNPPKRGHGKLNDGWHDSPYKDMESYVHGETKGSGHFALPVRSLSIRSASPLNPYQGEAIEC